MGMEDAKNGNVKPKHPVRATTTATNVKFIISFTRMGTTGKVLNSILPNEYPQAGQVGAEKYIQKFQVVEERQRL